ncbi:hypothetical protein AURDEDRAFT_171269 [Auricularia subglabra TFB-10046 SS5]|nr:hypothetical protein AURDEDRAFT_171269 [Auricularia subglabra TFB-10046 SS5]
MELVANIGGRQWQMTSTANFDVRIPLLAMYRHQGTRALPVELLATVFNALSVSELVTASHVSSFWRAVACRHQSYWRKIRLAALSTSALDFFHARLDAGSDRSVTVDICLDEVELPARMRSVVLPAISRNLYRIDKLYLRIEISFDVDLFSALEYPAPRLDTLDVILCHETRSSDALPANLFASHAPKLQDVRVLNAQLFDERLPPAFSSVVKLRYCFNQAQSFPASLFQHCKRLQSLTMYGKYCTLSGDDLLAAPVEDWQLKSVEVGVFTGSLDLMRHIPYADIASITVAVNDELSAELLLAHLRGRLELRLLHTPDNVYVQYTSLETGLQRAFVCVHEQVALACLPPVLTASSLVSRVDVLSCSSSCIPLLSAFDELQSCTRLAVSLADGDLLHLPPRPLSLPALECVEISSSDAALLPPPDILAFLEAAVLPLSRAVRVALIGIALDGEPSTLGDQFIVSQTACT